MGDSSKFQTIIQYHMFNAAFVALLISELIIFVKTYQKNKKCKRNDKGTKWLLIAVFKLKKAFTIAVQTTDSQKLITTGIYHMVRNPAHSGSILSLVGVATAYRSIPGIVLVLLIAIACYSVRIHVEEKALEKQFGTEFEVYKANSWRLIPHIW